MTPELERGVKRHKQWFGSYRKSGELVKVQVWLTVNSGYIEFLTLDDSYKVKRIRRDPRVVCYIGDQNGPSIPGTAEIVTGGTRSGAYTGPIGKHIRLSWHSSRSQSEDGSETVKTFSFASTPMSPIPWPA